MRILFLTLSFFLFLFIVNCSKDKALPTNNTNNNICDSVDSVSFSNDIEPILNGNGCYGCHSSTSPLFNDYNTVYNNKEDILLAIQHDLSKSPMPKGMPKLNDSLINKVYCWIENGAPNN